MRERGGIGRRTGFRFQRGQPRESSSLSVRTKIRIARPNMDQSQSESETEEEKRLQLAELRREIAIGSEEADRGEFVDAKETFAEIRRRSADRKRARG